MKKAEFEAFYHRHVDRVYRFVYFRVQQSREVAEDLTSEIFMKALRAFDRYDAEQSDVAWIMKIARNHVINHYRDKKEAVDIDEFAFVLTSEDGREKEERRDDARRLRAAMDGLEKSDRLLIELKHLQGYRFKEIAEIVKKSPGACRVETHRALKKLKTLMKEYYDLSPKQS